MERKILNKNIPLTFEGIDEKGREIWRVKGYWRKEERIPLPEDPSCVSPFFENYGFQTVSPMEITKSRTTLFVCAGIQILEDILEGDKIPNQNFKLFVAQPVLRSQFIGFAGEGISTCFINLSTGAIGIDQKKHMEIFEVWLKFLASLGIDFSEVRFLLEKRVDKWGKREFFSDIIRIRYKDISLGDAKFITQFPANFGETTISDIGFGLERINWMLSDGKSYWAFLGTESLKDFNILDAWNTLALLSGAGIKASNNERGYRFRKVAKLLCEKLGYQRDTEYVFLSAFRRWKKWINLSLEEEEAKEEVKRELDRNANAVLKRKLEERGYCDVGIDINLPPKEFLKLLKGTSVRKEILEKILVEMSYLHD